MKVNGTKGATVLNKASVLEGKNAYTTNEVSSPIHATEIPPAPQTGDRMNLSLWFAVLFVSGGGVITSSIFGRKRKEEA